MSRVTDLRYKLLSQPTREHLVSGCVELVESHIRQRRGWKGTAMRAGLALLRSIRTDAVRLGVERLLPDFVDALLPFHDAFQRQGGGDFGAWLRTHDAAVADALIRVADQRVASSGNAGVKSAYGALRRFAHDEVGTSLPEVGRLIEQHAG